MTSIRKKYQDRVEIGSHNEGPPAATVPTQGAELPPAAATKPPEPPVESNPVDEAAKNALRDRLREMENAEGFARQAQQQPAQHIQEQEPVQDQVEAALASMPEATANWLRAHPEYINDPRKNAALQHFHWVACDETGEEYTQDTLLASNAILVCGSNLSHSQAITDRSTDRAWRPPD